MMAAEVFRFSDERFADIQMLRYRLNGFDHLSARQKRFVYYLSQATLYGRDVTFDQFGKYNLRIRKMLEVVFTDLRVPHDSTDFQALEVYLKRVWCSNGIYHHYGCEKFKPDFSQQFLRDALHTVEACRLPLNEGQTVDELCDELFPVIFDPEVLPKRVNKADGEDLVTTSACHFYEGVTQQEAEDFYAVMKQADDEEPPSYGLNSTLVKEDGVVKELTWSVDGRYANALRHIVTCLQKAREEAESEQQKKVVDLLIR